MCDKYVIGYSISEKKRQKFNWNDFCSVCESEGFLLKMVNNFLSFLKLLLNSYAIHYASRYNNVRLCIKCFIYNLYTSIIFYQIF